jgi:drug/metabolite transporter (DMT)-like permease
MVLATFVWGSGHPIGKLILRELTPQQLSFLSSALGGATLFVVLCLTRRVAHVARVRGKSLFLTLAAGAIMFFLYPNLSFSALRLIPASANSILIASSTIFVALLAAAILKEKLVRVGYLGILLSFIGIFLVILSTESGGLVTSGLSTVGSIIALLAALASASYAIIGRELRGSDPISVTMLGAAVGTMLQGGVLLGSSDLNSIIQASPTTYLLVAYWGIFSGLGYVAYYYCLGRIQATKVSSFVYLSPLFATVLSFVMLGENLTGIFMGGLTFTLVGIWLTQRNKGFRVLLNSPSEI